MSEVSGQSVCLVIVCSEDGEEYAVFSNLEAASEFADKQKPSCVIAYPMVVDHPDYGNVPSGQAN